MENEKKGKEINLFMLFARFGACAGEAHTGLFGLWARTRSGNTHLRRFKGEKHLDVSIPVSRIHIYLLNFVVCFFIEKLTRRLV